MPGWLPLVKAGVGGGGTLALVGTAKTAPGVYSDPNTLTLTTTAPARIVLFYADNGRNPINQTVSDVAGLTWTQRIIGGAGPNFAEWWADASAPLTGDVITIGCAGLSSYSEAIAVAVSGGSGFDPNGALPATIASGALTLSTSNPNTLMLAAFRGNNPIASGGGTGPAAGWTLALDGDFMGVEYKIVSAPQTGITVPDPNGNNGAIGDAITS
jgi:hypothetical protein